MNKDLIAAVANILGSWNPLGEKANSVESLDGYRIEAIDILSSSKILRIPIKKAVKDVLEQAFDISINEVQLSHYSNLIEHKVNELNH